MSRDRFWGKIALAGFSTLAALCVVELALRVLGPAPTPPDDTLRTFTEYDAELGWKGRPGARGPYRAHGFATAIALNSGGWRDDEWPAAGLSRAAAEASPSGDAAATGAPPGPIVPANPPGERTMVCLGDSFAWGYGVNRGEIFADRVEAALPGWDVRNYAVSGYGTDQELLVLRKYALAAHPRIVIVEFALENDIGNILGTTAYRLPKPRFVLAKGGLRIEGVPVKRIEDWDHPAQGSAAKDWLQTHVRLYAWTRPRWAALKTRLGRATGLRENRLADEGRVRLLARVLDRRLDEGWRLAEAILAAIRDEAERGGARVVILAVPDRLQSDDTLWDEAMRTFRLDQSAFDREGPDRRLAEIASRLGVPVADPLSALRERERMGEECFLPGDIHWNARGHEVAARTLLVTLEPLVDKGGAGR